MEAVAVRQIRAQAKELRKNHTKWVAALKRHEVTSHSLQRLFKSSGVEHLARRLDTSVRWTAGKVDERQPAD